jgi:hypothetical protein
MVKQQSTASENCRRLFAEALALFQFPDRQKREMALSMLNIILQQIEEIGDDERNEYLYFHRIWARVLDSEYVPPIYFDEAEVYPLICKSQEYVVSRQYQDALRHAWLYLQYCAAGTLDFLYALCDIADLALKLSDLLMARHAIEMFLSQYDLAISIVRHQVIGVEHKPASGLSWLEGITYQQITFPVHTALKALPHDPASCWVRVLVLALEQAPPNEQTKPQFKEILSALWQYYLQIGDEEGLDWLRAYGAS